VSSSCTCKARHQPRLVALTGGPGAGKSAVLELARRAFCEHVHISQEAATILYGGGYPRPQSARARALAQQAIFHVQLSLETAAAEGEPALVLCDRGTVDGLAYWPFEEPDYWREVHSSRREQIERYATVIHLCVPPPGLFDRSNPARLETAAEAARIDERTARAWEGHGRRVVIPASASFVEKALRALEALRGELPACCGGSADGRGPQPLRAAAGTAVAPRER